MSSLEDFLLGNGKDGFSVALASFLVKQANEVTLGRESFGVDNKRAEVYTPSDNPFSYDRESVSKKLIRRRKKTEFGSQLEEHLDDVLSNDISLREVRSVSHLLEVFFDKDMSDQALFLYERVVDGKNLFMGKAIHDLANLLLVDAPDYIYNFILEKGCEDKKTKLENGQILEYTSIEEFSDVFVPMLDSERVRSLGTFYYTGKNKERVTQKQFFNLIKQRVVSSDFGEEFSYIARFSGSYYQLSESLRSKVIEGLKKEYKFSKSSLFQFIVDSRNLVKLNDSFSEDFLAELLVKRYSSIERKDAMPEYQFKDSWTKHFVDYVNNIDNFEEEERSIVEDNISFFGDYKKTKRLFSSMESMKGGKVKRGVVRYAVKFYDNHENKLDCDLSEILGLIDDMFLRFKIDKTDAKKIKSKILTVKRLESHGYLDRWSKVIVDGSCQNYKEAERCVDVDLEGYHVLRRAGQGCWGEILKVKDEESSFGLYRALKIFKQNLEVDSAKSAIEKFGGIDEFLENMVMAEKYANDKVEALGRNVRVSSNFGYTPVPKYIGKVNLKDDGEKSIGLMYEFVDGETLEDCMKRSDLSEKQKINIAAKAAYALNYVHEALDGVHNDVKLDNFMITYNSKGKIDEDSQVLLLDLAFAQIEDHESSLKGKRECVAPENVSGGKTPDKRSDQYSFGVMLYELFSGKKPVEYHETGEDKQRFAFYVNKGDLRAETRCDILPDSIRGIVQRCLSYNPNNRYETMKNIEDDLVKVHKGGLE